MQILWEIMRYYRNYDIHLKQSLFLQRLGMMDFLNGLNLLNYKHKMFC